MASVPPEWLFPLFNPSSMTRFSPSTSSSSSSVYIKHPRLLTFPTYKSATHAHCALQEISRCEHILSRSRSSSSSSPHPHIAHYQGVRTRQICGKERVTGIAYKAYDTDLHAFVVRDGLLRQAHVATLLAGVREGVKYLHAMGLVHCDVRPANVFVSYSVSRGEEECGEGCGDVALTEVVLGDFDASVPVGERITLKRASKGWWPEKLGWGAEAQPWIDEWGVEKLGRWLREEVAGGGGEEEGKCRDEGEQGLREYVRDEEKTESGWDEGVDELAEYVIETLAGGW